MTLWSHHLMTGAACSVSTGCLEDSTKRVRDRAYQLWEDAGRPWGHEHEFWAKASAEIEGAWPTLAKAERIVAR